MSSNMNFTLNQVLLQWAADLPGGEESSAGAQNRDSRWDQGAANLTVIFWNSAEWWIFLLKGENGVLGGHRPLVLLCPQHGQHNLSDQLCIYQSLSSVWSRIIMVSLMLQVLFDYFISHLTCPPSCHQARIFLYNDPSDDEHHSLNSSISAFQT